jgi:transposase-like protein
MGPMSMIKEPEIKRWTAKRKVELIKQIYLGQTTIAEAARNNDITQQEVGCWMDEAEMGMENALKTNPKYIEQLYQKKIDDLHAAYGEAMLENKFLKKLHSHLESTED